MIFNDVHYVFFKKTVEGPFGTPWGPQGDPRGSPWGLQGPPRGGQGPLGWPLWAPPLKIMKFGGPLLEKVPEVPCLCIGLPFLELIPGIELFGPSTTDRDLTTTRAGGQDDVSSKQTPSNYWRLAHDSG